MNPDPHPADIPGDRFAIDGALIEATATGSGHIHDTFTASYRAPDGTVRRYIHQRLNQIVFPDLPALMENICRVTNHIRAKLEKAKAHDIARRVLTVIPTRDERLFLRDESGSCWRTYRLIEHAHTHDRVTAPRQAREAARVLGQFQCLLADLPAPRLKETIPDFHNTPARYEALREAIEQDRHRRVDDAAKEIACIVERSAFMGILLEQQRAGEMPERITHNDTKISNVLFDRATGEALCLIDLDTVMPGLALYDFGDLVRTAASSAAEDEQDLSKVRVRMDLFDALTEGYLSAAHAFLNRTEIAHLAIAGKLIALETGIRFLTDHLNGDRYFKVARLNHNLDRARNQLKLVESMDAQKEEMERRVRTAADRYC